MPIQLEKQYIKALKLAAFSYFYYLIYWICIQYYHWMPRLLHNEISIIKLSYAILPNTLPVIFFLVSELWNIKLHFKKPLIIATTCLCTILMFLQFQPIAFQQVFGFRWTYISALEYLAFFTCYFLFLNCTVKNQFKSFTYALMLIVATGLIYELPIWHTYQSQSVFYSFAEYPFVINTKWILIPLAIWKIGYRNFLNIQTLIALCLLLAFSIFYHFNPYFGTNTNLIIRLSTLIFWIVPLTMKKQVSKVCGLA